MGVDFLVFLFIVIGFEMVLYNFLEVLVGWILVFVVMSFLFMFFNWFVFFFVIIFSFVIMCWLFLNISLYLNFGRRFMKKFK